MSDRTYVYIIGNRLPEGICGPVKIGVAANPSARLAQLQTGNHAKLEIAAAFCCPNRETARSIEDAFHSVLEKKQLLGEWFAMGPIEAVELMCLNIRAHLSSFDGWSTEEQDQAYYLCGAWHAGRKAREDKYVAAWESQAA